MPPRLTAPGLPKLNCCQYVHWEAAHSSNARQPQSPRRQASIGPTTLKGTRLRRDMYAWLNGPGNAFRNPLPNSTNYLGAYDRLGRLTRAMNRRRFKPGEKGEDDSAQEDTSDDGNDATADTSALPKERLVDLRPYPLNKAFRSQAVLSEALRNVIYEQVVEQDLDITAVSAVYNVDTRRVAAVVRLKTIEKQWLQQGKPLAKPYNDAVLAMLPQTQYQPDARRPPIHENVNDLPVHPWTRRQIFHPTSESREFTREDAAKVFHDKLLPPDERIAHPELVQMQNWENEGVSEKERRERQVELNIKAKEEEAKLEERRKKWEQQTQVVVPGRRWDFKFQDIGSNDPGKDGRRRAAVGARYGFPHEDRKRGMMKIPRVE